MTELGEFHVVQVGLDLHVVGRSRRGGVGEEHPCAGGPARHQVGGDGGDDPAIDPDDALAAELQVQGQGLAGEALRDGDVGGEPAGEIVPAGPALPDADGGVGYGVRVAVLA